MSTRVISWPASSSPLEVRKGLSSVYLARDEAILVASQLAQFLTREPGETVHTPITHSPAAALRALADQIGD